MTDITLVTALFDLGRGSPELHPATRRSLETYIQAFEQMLRVEAPLVVYTEAKLEALVWRHRHPSNTRVVLKTLQQLRDEFHFFPRAEQIRQSPRWQTQAPWLATSPQALLPLYNPLVLSKLFWLHDAVLTNAFQSSFFLWVDAGLTLTLDPGDLLHPLTLRRLQPLLHKFLLLRYPYPDGQEIHGFCRQGMHRFAGDKTVRWVARGGLFGGHGDYIRKVHPLYHHLLDAALQQGYLGTEESLLTLMAHLEPDHFQLFELGSDGLVGPFFRALHEGSIELTQSGPPNPALPAERATLVYLTSFESPEQFELTVESWSPLHAGPRYLIDNSRTDARAQEYDQLCQRYGFTLLHRGQNLGISGARQFVAEHFATTGEPFMLYLEDDMLLKARGAPPCASGMNAHVEGLLFKARAIIEREQVDFLKLSFTEFFGHHGQQWAWYNVSPVLRAVVWPDKPMSQVRYRSDLPEAQFFRLGTLQGLAYAVGQVYYGNWPHLIGQAGNRKIFLDERWEKPNEAYWMAHVFELQLAQRLTSGVLLASPVAHQRLHTYPSEVRRES